MKSTSVISQVLRKVVFLSYTLSLFYMPVAEFSISESLIF